MVDRFKHKKYHSLQPSFNILKFRKTAIVMCFKVKVSFTFCKIWQFSEVLLNNIFSQKVHHVPYVKIQWNRDFRQIRVTYLLYCFIFSRFKSRLKVEFRVAYGVKIVIQMRMKISMKRINISTSYNQMKPIVLLETIYFRGCRFVTVLLLETTDPFLHRQIVVDFTTVCNKIYWINSLCLSHHIPIRLSAKVLSLS